MTSGLRKAHKIIWLVLVILVPVIMIFSIKDLNIFSSENHKSLVTHNKSTKDVISSNENDIIKVSLYENHLEIILKSTLKSATSIVYDINSKGDRSNFIGQLTTAGIYKFDINNLPKGIIIYDTLKDVEITKLTF